MPITPQPSCSDATEPSMLPIPTALERIRAALTPPTQIEQVALRQALGRVLAEDISSPINVPAQTNSAMDGYAVRSEDLEATELDIIGTAWAGKPFQGEVAAGQTVRIMTGAAMPEGTDTVIIQEHCEVDGKTAQFTAGQTAGQNVRQAGEDLAVGQSVLQAGRLIQAADLGLIASLGIPEVTVRRQLRVAFFSTGDELRSLGELLDIGQIYDSNRYTLYGMLQQLGVDVLDMGVVRDDRDALETAFRMAADQADVLITSGGVSVGEADFTKEILQRLGDIAFWTIAMKPGRPLAFGKIGETAFFGLPGNPVAVMVTFYQFVQPALQYLMGYEPPLQPIVQARSLTRFRKKPGRAEFPRGLLQRDESGNWTVQAATKQGSGILRSMSTGNCFVLLQAEQGTVEVGDMVEVQMFVSAGSS